MGYGRHYPIWNKVTACIYNSIKSYGVKDTGETEIYVGSSAKNSHFFCKHLITQRDKHIDKWGECKVFTFSVDDIVIKQMVFKTDKKGRAEELVKTNIVPQIHKY
jgi:hypothetical protein